jgi:hypothetical protein
VCLAQQPDVKPHRIFRTRRSRASPKRGPEGQNYSRFILRIFGGPSGPKSCSETLRETTSAANYRICTMILSSVMKSVHCRMQSILPPSAELCCHPVQRHAATSGDHQRVCKSHPRRRRAAPQLRFGQDDVRLVFRGSKVRFADHPPRAAGKHCELLDCYTTTVWQHLGPVSHN